MADLDWTQQRILVVDSDVTYLEWVVHLFEYVGIAEVKAAKDGDKALEILQSGYDADVIILELEMQPRNLKGMNSVSFVRRVRDAEQVPYNDIPIVITSPDAKKNPGLLRSICLGGIESFVTKPSSIEQFLKRIGKTIQMPLRFVAHRSYFGPERRQFPPVAYDGKERRRSRPSATLLSRYIRAAEKSDLSTNEMSALINNANNAVEQAIEQAIEQEPLAARADKGANPAPASSPSAAALAAQPMGKERGKGAKTASPTAKPTSDKTKQDAIKSPPARKSVKPAPAPAKKAKTRNWDDDLTDAPPPEKEKKNGGLLSGLLGKKKKKNSQDDWDEALGPDKKKNGKAEKTGPDVGAIAEKHQAWLLSHGREGEKAVLKGMDLHGASLHGLNLKNANLQDAILSDADCSDANLEGADLRRIDLSGSTVTNGNLAVCNMRHANLKAANLDGAILRGVDLAGACLSLGSFKETDMTGSNLLGTDLRDADLSQTVGLQQRQLNKVVGDSSTTLPPGLRVPEKN